MAQESHKKLRKSKQVADVYHNKFIFLVNRLYRELRKRFHLIRIQENKLSNEENSDFVMDVKEIIVDFYVDEFKDSEIMEVIFHEDILVTLGKKFCSVVFTSGQGGYLLGKKNKRVKRLAQILHNEYQINFKISISPSSISQDDIKTTIYKHLEQINNENPEFEDVDISSVEFSSSDNRKVTLKSRNVKLLWKHDFINSVKRVLKERFAVSFIVIGGYMDVDHSHLEQELMRFFEQKNILDCIQSVDISANKKGIKGRRITINTTNVIECVKERRDIIEALELKFGPKFSLDFYQDLPPLKLSEISDMLLKIIDDYVSEIDDFAVHEIDIKNYYKTINY